MKQLKNLIILISALSLSGCLILPLQESDPDQSLHWCPPLPNCASTESATFVHSIQPFELKMPFNEAWPIIRETVNELPRTLIEHDYQGYIYAKTHSAVFQFVDYFEVLADPEEKQLHVRSSSLLGIWDLFVNYFRTEDFRERLEAKGVIQTKE